MTRASGIRRPVRQVLAAAVCAAALLLAGCGGEEEPITPAAPAGGGGGGGAETGGGATATPIKLAAAATTEAGSARMSTQTSTVAGGITVEVTSEGVFDFAGQRGTMETTIAGRPTQTVIDAGVVYTQLAPEMAAAVGGKSWLKVEVGGAAFGTPGASSPMGPDSFLKALQGNSTGLTEVGQEQVRGGDTATHYRATMDVASAPGGPQLTQLLGETLPVEVWVDGEGRLRKLVTDVSLNSAAGEVRSTSTVELWDFGVPVEVTVPPAGQVVTSDELTGAIQDALSGG